MLKTLSLIIRISLIRHRSLALFHACTHTHYIYALFPLLQRYKDGQWEGEARIQVLFISALLSAMASSRSSCSCCLSLFSLSRSALSLSRLAHSICCASFPNWRMRERGNRGSVWLARKKCTVRYTDTCENKQTWKSYNANRQNIKKKKFP